MVDVNNRHRGYRAEMELLENEWSLDWTPETVTECFNAKAAARKVPEELDFVDLLSDRDAACALAMPEPNLINGVNDDDIRAAVLKHASSSTTLDEDPVLPANFFQDYVQDKTGNALAKISRELTGSPNTLQTATGIIDLRTQHTNHGDVTIQMLIDTIKQDLSSGEDSFE